MSTRKVLFLLLVFLFPLSLVFIFQFFSEGVYEVPPLYEEGVTDVPAGCPYDYSKKPYLLPDSLYAKEGVQEALLTLYYFNGSGNENRLNLKRIREQFDAGLVTVTEMPESEDVVFLRRCVFLAGKDTAAVLADSARRIRGYYGSSLEEMDRLIVEMKIILEID